MINSIPKCQYDNLNLKELETYTLKTFKGLRQERFLEKMPYYICLINQKERTYFFDASQFLEDYISKKGCMTNPLTRQPIEDFEITSLLKKLLF